MNPAQILAPLRDPSASPEAVTTAVERLTNLVSDSSGNVGNVVCATFGAVFDAADSTAPEHQGPLLDFLARLQQTAATDSAGTPLRFEYGVLWTDMPTFGWVARDLWNFGRFLLNQLFKSQS